MSIYIGNSEIKNVYIGTTPVKEVYVGTTKVRPTGWQPTSSTRIYYDFNGDVNNKATSSNNATVSGTITYQTLASGKKVGTVNTSTNITYPKLSYSAPFTAVIWYKMTGYADWAQFMTIFGNNIITRLMVKNPYAGSFYGLETDKPSFVSTTFGISRDDGKWHCAGMSFSTSRVDFYLDGNRYSGNSNGWTGSDTSTNGTVCTNVAGSIGAYIEDLKYWSPSDMLAYYKLTKGEYGIS